MKKLLAAFAFLATVFITVPAQATHTIDFGAYVQTTGTQSSQEAYTAFEATGGQLDLTRHYQTSWTDVQVGGFIAWSASQGHSPYISLHVTDEAALTGITWATIAAGEQDSFLTAWANGLQDLGVTVWWSFQHEPENDLYAGTPAEFKAATEHAYDLMKPICTNCQIGPIFMRNTFTGAHGGVDAWLPDAAHMDYVGADLYANYGSITPLSQLAAPSLAKARSFGKPLFIGEFGVGGTGTTNTEKATWLKAARIFLKANTDIVGACYSQTVAVGGDFRVTTGSAPLKAWKAITSDPYFQ